MPVGLCSDCIITPESGNLWAKPHPSTTCPVLISRALWAQRARGGSSTEEVKIIFVCNRLPTIYVEVLWDYLGHESTQQWGLLQCVHVKAVVELIILNSYSLSASPLMFRCTHMIACNFHRAALSLNICHRKMSNNRYRMWNTHRDKKKKKEKNMGK